MAVSFTLKLDGITYRGKSLPDGTVVYDPPLPESDAATRERNLKEVFETRSFPGLNTDTTFLANRGTLDKQIEDPIALKTVVEGAKRDGFTPSPNHVYMSSVARYPGDRQAWLTAGDAKGHIRKICEERNVGCYGSVNIPQPDRKISPEEARVRDRAKALEKREKARAKMVAAMKKKAGLT